MVSNVIRWISNMSETMGCFRKFNFSQRKGTTTDLHIYSILRTDVLLLQHSSGEMIYTQNFWQE